MNSLSEASYYGIPMLCIPLFGDQKRNCRTVEKRHIGISVDKTELIEENLIKIFKEFIENER